MVSGNGKGYLEQPALHTQAPYRAALNTYPGNLRQALKDSMTDPKKALFGVGSGVPSVFYTKVLVSAKPDFLWLDNEHGVFGRLELYECIQAAIHHSEGHTMVIVRVAKGDVVGLTTALDAGAAGIVLPHTESAKEVQEFIKECYYPPIGHRSFSPWTFTPGVSDSSLYPNDSFNLATSNNHVCILPQIESVKGVEMVDEIAALDCVNGLMFGPGDFMLDAAIPVTMAGPPHPVLLDAMMKFGQAGIKHGKPLMGNVMSLDQIPMMMGSGFRIIGVYMDVWNTATAIKGNMDAARVHAEGFADGQKKETEADAEKEAGLKKTVVSNGN